MYKLTGKQVITLLVVALINDIKLMEGLYIYKLNPSDLLALPLLPLIVYLIMIIYNKTKDQFKYVEGRERKLCQK